MYVSIIERGHQHFQKSHSGHDLRNGNAGRKPGLNAPYGACYCDVAECEIGVAFRSSEAVPQCMTPDWTLADGKTGALGLSGTGLAPCLR